MSSFSNEDKPAGAGKRIESPLAKYNATGQLVCIVCSQVVKSEALWTAHINSRAHLDNKAKLKSKLKGDSDASFKKPTAPGTAVTKKPAEKAPETSSAGQKRPLDDKDLYEGKKQRMDKIISKTNRMDLNKIIAEEEASSSDLPIKQQTTTAADEPEPESAQSAAEAAPVSLPEGFFDDPELDAKARGTTREETLEAEYEAFKKAMMVEEVKSNTIIEQDDQNRELDRDLEEVDELISRWSKIEELHKKKEGLVKAKTAAAANPKQDSRPQQTGDSDSDDSDVDLTNVLDLKLRNKKIL